MTQESLHGGIEHVIGDCEKYEGENDKNRKIMARPLKSISKKMQQNMIKTVRERLEFENVSNVKRTCMSSRELVWVVRNKRPNESNKIFLAYADLNLG